MTVRWTIEVSEATDCELRAHLAERGLSHLDLSRFIEELVQDRLAEAVLFDAPGPDGALGKGDISGMVADAMKAESSL